MICELCAICVQPYGTHTNACPAPRPKPPEPTREERAENLETLRARQLEEWIRGRRAA